MSTEKKIYDALTRNFTSSAIILFFISYRTTSMEVVFILHFTLYLERRLKAQAHPAMALKATYILQFLVHITFSFKKLNNESLLFDDTQLC